MNDQNLKTPTASEARELGRKGGIASGRSRLAKKRGRELMLAMLSMKETDPQVIAQLAQTWGVDAKALTKELAMNARQIDKAIRKADTAAFKEVHRVAGTFENDETGNTTTIQIVVSSKDEADKIASIGNIG